MYRLTYVSTAAAELSMEDVEALTRRASEKNTRAGISGALAFNGRNFVQVLEGEVNAVKALFEVIGADPRHFGVRVMEENDQVEACFPARGMLLVSNDKHPSEWQMLQQLVADVTIDQLPVGTRDLFNSSLALS